MNILDFRPYGEDLTLKICGEAYDAVTQKGELPNKIQINKFQQEHFFSTVFGNLEYWRGVPIEVK